MKTKHTKGEWKISQALSDRHQITILSKSHIITEVKKYGDVDKKQEIEANAILIAAAPELLEFAIEMVFRYPNSPCVCEPGNKIIKKATE